MKRELLRSGVTVALLRMVGAALGLAVTVMLSRTVGADGLGIYAYAVTCLALGAVPLSHGWSTMLLRATSAAAHSNDWGEVRGMAARGFQYACALSISFLVLGLIIFALFPALAQGHISVLTLIILLCILGCDQFSAIRASILRGLNSQAYAYLPEMLIKPALLIAIFFILFLRFDTSSTLNLLFAALLIASAASAGIGEMILRHISPASLIQATPIYKDKLWLEKASIFAAYSSLMLLNGYVDILILGFFVPASEIGLYRVATQVAMVSGLAYVALNMIAAQRFALYQSTDDQKSAQKVAALLSAIALLVALPVVILLFAFAETIVLYLFGPEFVGAVGPLLILCSLQIIIAAAGMPHVLLNMSGHATKLTQITSGAVILNLFFCSVLIPQFGATGAAVATFFATAIWYVVIWRIALRQTGIDTSITSLALRRFIGLSRRIVIF